MHDYIMLGLELLVFIVFGLIGVVFKMVFNSIKDIEKYYNTLDKSITAHKLHAAETFATKVDVDKGFDRVMDKLDSIDGKLDQKADKT